MKESETSRSHYIGHRERLRRRFLENGLKGFQDYEALELLLTYGIARRDTKPTAKALMKRFKSLPGVFDAEIQELAEVEGVGEKTALLIKLCPSLMERYMKREVMQRPSISCPESVIRYCKVSMGGLKDEQFRALYLNARNEILSEEVIHEGTVDHAVVYPRKVFEYAFKHKAVAIILVHNHPGGSLKPSRSDIELTERLRKAASELGIRIHDHLIITAGGYYSFHEGGLL